MTKRYIVENYSDGEKFKPTVEWMQDRYNKANQELFNGELGACDFKAEPIKHNTNWLGSFRTNAVGTLYVEGFTQRLYVVSWYGNDKQYVNRDNFCELCRPIITLSTYYSGTEESLYATLVHEMCHYYVWMSGHAPKQAHGPEFRQIGNYAAYRSNGQLTVQRIASAEQMEGYDVDDEIKQRRERRAAAKKANAHYYLIVWESGQVGLINPTDNCLRNIISREQRSGSDVKAILDVTDSEITNELYDKFGFKLKMRTYRYWSNRAGITKNSEIIQKILNNPNTHKIILKNE